MREVVLYRLANRLRGWRESRAHLPHVVGTVRNAYEASGTAIPSELETALQELASGKPIELEAHERIHDLVWKVEICSREVPPVWSALHALNNCFGNTLSSRKAALTLISSLDKTDQTLLQQAVIEDLSDHQNLQRFLEAPPVVIKPSTPSVLSKLGRVLIVENDEGYARDLKDLVYEELGIQPTLAMDYHSALESLPSPGQRPGLTNLVFLSLGLPPKAGEPEDRVWGLRLLGKFREYAVNWRVIILTGAGGALNEHLAASQTGVHPEDFLFKFPGQWEQEVRECLRRFLAWLGRPHDLVIFEPLDENLRGRYIALDGVRFEIDVPYYRTLRALDGEPRLVSDIKSKVLEDEADPEKHIYKLRRQIQERMAQAERSVAINRIIRTVKVAGENAYCIGCNVRWEKDIDPEQVRPQVLIVEDDPTWRYQIAGACHELQLEFDLAASVSQAEAALSMGNYSILCLDLQLPGFDEIGGLEVLKLTRQSQQRIGIVVLSDLAQDDLIRTQLLRAGVRATDFLSKIDENWQDRLHRSLYRFILELQRVGILYPETPDARPVYRVELVELENGRGELIVDGITVKCSPQRFKLLVSLDYDRNVYVTADQIFKDIYDEEAPLHHENRIVNLVRNTRNAIKRAFDAEGREIDPKDVIAQDRGDYMLRGR